MGRFSVSVVIPSWNGLQLLRENLGSVLAAVCRYRDVAGAETEVLVVDDGSRDQTVDRLPLEFPEIRLIPRKVNGGFAVACNSGFRECRGDLVVLLNNDVEVSEEYLLPQVRHFERPEVFAVTAKVFEWERKLFTTGGRYGRFRRGFWSVYFNYDVEISVAEEWIEGHRLLSAYAIGGFATYDRAKLMELGGFNELLSPFHWEDVDLSYRAWKRGWEVHYEPRSVARHRTSATINAHFQKKKVDSVSFRNRLLFHWINLHSRRYLARHLAMLLILFLSRVLVLDFRFYRSFFEALRWMPSVIRLRRRERARTKRSDRELQELLKRFYRDAPLRVYYNRAEVMEKHPESR